MAMTLRKFINQIKSQALREAFITELLDGKPDTPPGNKKLDAPLKLDVPEIRRRGRPLKDRQRDAEDAVNASIAVLNKSLSGALRGSSNVEFKDDQKTFDAFRDPNAPVAPIPPQPNFPQDLRIGIWQVIDRMKEHIQSRDVQNLVGDANPTGNRVAAAGAILVGTKGVLNRLTTPKNIGDEPVKQFNDEITALRAREANRKDAVDRVDKVFNDSRMLLILGGLSQGQRETLKAEFVETLLWEDPKDWDAKLPPDASNLIAELAKEDADVTKIFRDRLALSDTPDEEARVADVLAEVFASGAKDVSLTAGIQGAARLIQWVIQTEAKTNPDEKRYTPLLGGLLHAVSTETTVTEFPAAVAPMPGAVAAPAPAGVLRVGAQDSKAAKDMVTRFSKVDEKHRGNLRYAIDFLSQDPEAKVSWNDAKADATPVFGDVQKVFTFLGLPDTFQEAKGTNVDVVELLTAERLLAGLIPYLEHGTPPQETLSQVLQQKDADIVAALAKLGSRGAIKRRLETLAASVDDIATFKRVCVTLGITQVYSQLAVRAESFYNQHIVPNISVSTQPALLAMMAPDAKELQSLKWEPDGRVALAVLQNPSSTRAEFEAAAGVFGVKKADKIEAAYGELQTNALIEKLKVYDLALAQLLRDNKGTVTQYLGSEKRFGDPAQFEKLMDSLVPKITKQKDLNAVKNILTDDFGIPKAAVDAYGNKKWAVVLASDGLAVADTKVADAKVAAGPVMPAVPEVKRPGGAPSLEPADKRAVRLMSHYSRDVLVAAANNQTPGKKDRNIPLVVESVDPKILAEAKTLADLRTVLATANLPVHDKHVIGALHAYTLSEDDLRDKFLHILAERRYTRPSDAKDAKDAKAGAATDVEVVGYKGELAPEWLMDRVLDAGEIKGVKNNSDKTTAFHEALLKRPPDQIAHIMAGMDLMEELAGRDVSGGKMMEGERRTIFAMLKGVGKYLSGTKSVDAALNFFQRIGGNTSLADKVHFVETTCGIAGGAAIVNAAQVRDSYQELLHLASQRADKTLYEILRDRSHLVQDAIRRQLVTQEDLHWLMHFGHFVSPSHMTASDRRLFEQDRNRLEKILNIFDPGNQQATLHGQTREEQIHAIIRENYRADALRRMPSSPVIRDLLRKHGHSLDSNEQDIALEDKGVRDANKRITFKQFLRRFQEMTHAELDAVTGVKDLPEKMVEISHKGQEAYREWIRTSLRTKNRIEPSDDEVEKEARPFLEALQVSAPAVLADLHKLWIIRQHHGAGPMADVLLKYLPDATPVELEKLVKRLAILKTAVAQQEKDEKRVLSDAEVIQSICQTEARTSISFAQAEEIAYALRLNPGKGAPVAEELDKLIGHKTSEGVLDNIRGAVKMIRFHGTRSYGEIKDLNQTDIDRHQREVMKQHLDSLKQLSSALAQYEQSVQRHYDEVVLARQATEGFTDADLVKRREQMTEKLAELREVLADIREVRSQQSELMGALANVLAKSSSELHAGFRLSENPATDQDRLYKKLGPKQLGLGFGPAVTLKQFESGGLEADVSYKKVEADEKSLVKNTIANMIETARRQAGLKAPGSDTTVPAVRMGFLSRGADLLPATPARYDEQSKLGSEELIVQFHEYKEELGTGYTSLSTTNTVILPDIAKCSNEEVQLKLLRDAARQLTQELAHMRREGIPSSQQPVVMYDPNSPLTHMAMAVYKWMGFDAIPPAGYDPKKPAGTILGMGGCTQQSMLEKIKLMSNTDPVWKQTQNPVGPGMSIVKTDVVVATARTVAEEAKATVRASDESSPSHQTPGKRTEPTPKAKPVPPGSGGAVATPVDDKRAGAISPGASGLGLGGVAAPAAAAPVAARKR